MRIRVSNTPDGGYLVEFYGTRGQGQGYEFFRRGNRAEAVAKGKEVIERIEGDRQVRRLASRSGIG